jgi:signal transduction histidine kinase
VQRVCHYYERIASKKSIRVVTALADDLPPVWTDRVAAAVVLDNLLSNAVKFSQPGTQVEVRVQGEERWARCDVRDQGPGLSREDQGKLF